MPKFLIKGFIADAFGLEHQGGQLTFTHETERLDREFAQTILDNAKKSLKESGGCDHSVGICACDEIDAVTLLSLSLAGLTWCKKCGGDGFEFIEDEQETCTRCGGKGTEKL